MGEPARYAEPGKRDTANGAGIRRGQFYNVPLATAVGEFLEMRGREPATTDEILSALLKGGFDFDAMGWNPDTRLRSLGMSLSKNSPKFHRLPDQSWGLREWYPNLPPLPPRRRGESAPAGKAGAETEPEQEEGGDEP